MSIHPKFARMWHGGDYNPDQWLDRPDIIDEDFRLMRLAHCNAFSVGIFAWTKLEPEEGKFEFGWLDRIMDRMAEEGHAVALATPSGARPAWLAEKYPEVLRVDERDRRDNFRDRHNHCFASPIYREKVATINGKLAERYVGHPALALWHISNEYSGTCYSPLSLDSFRSWLKGKYGSLDELNARWWTDFWSHRYTAWSQIDPRDPTVDGLRLDWKRWTTHQTVDFMRHEIAAVRQHDPKTPVTTNFMGFFPGLDYSKFAPHLDVISDDAYPRMHDPRDGWMVAQSEAMRYDMLRCLKGQPWLQIESTPSSTNWMSVSKLKRPNQHTTMSMQAVAHGSEGTMMFQWRKGRGAGEKFHGAVVDHVGTEHTRVFRDVAQHGRNLQKLNRLVGGEVRSQVALIMDWEAMWALECSHGPSNELKKYRQTCDEHHRPFWQAGVATDVLTSDAPIDGYDLVVAPMLFMLQPGVAERWRQFVESGGTLVTTYLSGVVDESNRCFLGGFPGDGLRELFGVWSEEIDSLYPTDRQSVVVASNDPRTLPPTYAVREYAERLHAEGARVLATYGDDFFRGTPAITQNDVGSGHAIYVGCRADDGCQSWLCAHALELAGIQRPDVTLPLGVSWQTRYDGDTPIRFAMNFRGLAASLDLRERRYRDLLGDRIVEGVVEIPPYGTLALVEI